MNIISVTTNLEGEKRMSRPRAIFASVPPDANGIPRWDTTSGTKPVEYSKPYQYWPDLDWAGNSLDNNDPTEYGLERPKYLWSHSLVQDPVNGESYVFIRQWFAGQRGDAFDYQTIPADDLIVTITHAADNNYAMALIVGGIEVGTVQPPIGSNSEVPDTELSWRNAKTYLYHLDLTQIPPGTEINLVSEVINTPQIPHGIVETNPAMFTWVMQVFNK